MCFFIRVYFGEEYGSSHWQISVSCTIEECDSVTTPYYLSYLSRCPLREIKNKRKFQNFSSKSGRGRGCLREELTRGSKSDGDLTWNLLVFWKTGRWGEVVPTGGSTPFCMSTCHLFANQWIALTTLLYELDLHDQNIHIQLPRVYLWVLRNVKEIICRINPGIVPKSWNSGLVLYIKLQLILSNKELALYFCQNINNE